VWLDWTEPALPAAAKWLAQAARNRAGSPDSACDLRQVTCVVPGQRAGRLLLALLAERCEAEGLPLIPPAILTPGRLVDAAVALERRPTATAHEQVLAWLQALRATDEKTIAPLVPARPDVQDVLDWYDLSATVARIAEELAGERVTPADVAQQAEGLEFFGEADRWRALQSVHGAYRTKLAEAGLLDPHEARWKALESGDLAGTDRHLVLVGVVELNRMQRAAVEAWGDHVHALVHAPDSLEDRFDELGCLRAEAWADVPLDIEEDRIVVADRPSDQAQAVLRSLADFGGAYAPEEITVGLGDEAMQDLMARAGRSAGVPLHWAAGRNLARTAPYRLLEAAGEWLADGRLFDLGSLLRHPHFEAWLARRLPDQAGDKSAYLGLLDAYVGEHIQDDSKGGWLGKPQRRQRLEAIHGAVEELWARFRADDELTLGEWAKRIVETLSDIYALIGDDPDVAGDTLLAEACGAINDVCAQFARAASDLQPKLGAAAAIRIVLARAGREQLPLTPRRGDIEMLGWLELHLDLATAVVVAGCNDGHIPQSVTGDAFLPDALRRSLGMRINATRCRELRIVAGHRTAEGDALAPSRLMLVPAREQLPARVLRLCGESDVFSAQRPMGAPSPGDVTTFTVPELPKNLDLPERMSPTATPSASCCVSSRFTTRSWRWTPSPSAGWPTRSWPRSVPTRTSGDRRTRIRSRNSWSASSTPCPRHGSAAIPYRQCGSRSLAWPSAFGPSPGSRPIIVAPAGSLNTPRSTTLPRRWTCPGRIPCRSAAASTGSIATRTPARG
jgi:ATP-dependent helicase/nuclease subunit B